MKKYLIERKETLYFHVEARSKKKALELANQAGDMDYKMEVGEITDKIVEVDDVLIDEEENLGGSQ